MATVSTNNETPAYWSGVFAMTLCVFALIASEFMPVSLLTPMAVDLQVSEGMAGQGIAISGAFAVLTSLSISWLDRRAGPRLSNLHGRPCAHRCGHWRFLGDVRGDGHALGTRPAGVEGVGHLQWW